MPKIVNPPDRQRKLRVNRSGSACHGGGSSVGRAMVIVTGNGNLETKQCAWLVKMPHGRSRGIESLLTVVRSRSHYIWDTGFTFWKEIII